MTEENKERDEALTKAKKRWMKFMYMESYVKDNKLRETFEAVFSVGFINGWYEGIINELAKKLKRNL